MTDYFDWGHIHGLPVVESTSFISEACICKHPFFILICLAGLIACSEPESVTEPSFYSSKGNAKVLILSDREAKTDLKQYVELLEDSRDEQKTLRIRIKSLLPETHNWVLFPGSWDEVDVEIIHSSGQLKKQRTGHFVADHEKSKERWYTYEQAGILGLGFRNQVQLQLERDDTVDIRLNIRQYSGLPVEKNMELRLKDDLHMQHDLVPAFTQFLFLGMILALLLYHSMLFWNIRDNSYLFYALYMLALALHTIDYNGILSELFIPNYPHLRPYFKSLADNGIVIFYLHLLRSFVDTAEKLPHWDLKIRKVVMGMYFYLALTFLWIALEGNIYHMMFANVFASFVPIGIVIWMSRAIYFKGGKAARFFLLGTGFLITGNLVNFILLLWGIESREILGMFDRIQTLQLAVVLELMAFSLGLGYRTRLNQLEKQRLTELSQLKSKFFANLTHELRTPLTLILTPVEDWMRQNPDSSMQKVLKGIQANAHKLLGLIDQLMDFSRLEAGNLHLHVVETDWVSFIRARTSAFDSLARARDIQLSFSSDSDSVSVWIDREKMEQVFNNLLGNALKFVPLEGTVTVGIVESDDYVSVSISDTGPGIQEEDIPQIFDRFFQVEKHVMDNAKGAGIGLAFSKELVELHKGFIRVESEWGKGSVFTVVLQKGNEHLSQVEFEEGSHSEKPLTEMMAYVEHDPEEEEHKSLPAEKEDTSRPLVLIVEDNDELRTYLKNMLGREYRIKTEANGLSGWERIQDVLPDIVISDVMMPGIDGYELCSRLKTDPKTNHIPIILLTARSRMEEKFQGLNTGADDYLVKPFDLRELRLRSANLIRQRKRLWKTYESWVVVPRLPLPNGAPKDHEFVEKLKETLEAKYQDPDFNVEVFADALEMNRKQLYRKCLSVLGTSPSKLIRRFRLEKAVERFSQQVDKTIAEVAYDVGYNSVPNFSKSFKEEYQKTPKEFIHEVKNRNDPPFMSQI